MSMQSKKEYLQTLLKEGGYNLRSKKEKSQLLTEYCKNTGLNRKYIIRKIRTGEVWKESVKLKRFKIIADRYRNRRKRFSLRFKHIAAIYNYGL